MDVGVSSVHRRYILLALVIGILPFAALAAVAYHQSQAENQREIDSALDVVSRRVSEILNNVVSVLGDAARATGGECSEDAVALLRRNAYLHPSIREIGIIRDHHLACTSWGMVDPPMALSREDESLMGQGLTVYALDEPALGIAAISLTLGLRFRDGDQINAPVYPQAIYRVLDGYGVADVNIGVVLDGKHLLAARYGGRYRELAAGAEDDALFPADGYLHTVRSIPGFPLTIFAALAGIWLRYSSKPSEPAL